MKKTLIAVACAAFISTGAMAKPASNQPPKTHNNNHSVHMVNHSQKSAPHIGKQRPSHHSSHRGHGGPTVHVAHVYSAPPPPVHHHHHHSSHLDFGDALIAFAILASAF